MRNILLSPRTAHAIEQQVAKVLRDLGNPDPPLNLPETCALLRLDQKYYSTADESALGDFVHKMTVAGKQILARPTLLLEVVRKLDLKALYIPDRRRILVDASLPKPKLRWNEAHEISHSIIPWHEAFSTVGDDQQTLRPDCHAKIEAEANYGAGRLLFLQSQFDSAAADSGCGIKDVQKLGKYFGNTMTTTLWRLVEWQSTPAVGLISAHPHSGRPSEDVTSLFRYFIRSQSFQDQYPSVTEMDLFKTMKEYCSYVPRGPLGEAEIILPDSSGREHIFQFETFYNSYEALTVGIYLHPHETLIAV